MQQSSYCAAIASVMIYVASAKGSRTTPHTSQSQTWPHHGQHLEQRRLLFCRPIALLQERTRRLAINAKLCARRSVERFQVRRTCRDLDRTPNDQRCHTARLNHPIRPSRAALPGPKIKAAPPEAQSAARLIRLSQFKPQQLADRQRGGHVTPPSTTTKAKDSANGRSNSTQWL
jgi:hypothetical protein